MPACAIEVGPAQDDLVGILIGAFGPKEIPPTALRILDRRGGLASHHSCRAHHYVRRLPTRIVYVGARGGAVESQLPRYHSYNRCSWSTRVLPLGHDKLATARRRGREASVHDEQRV